MLRARWELFVYPGERGPTGNKFGPLPSSHEAAVQNNQPTEFQGSDVARRGDVAPSCSLQRVYANAVEIERCPLENLVID